MRFNPASFGWTTIQSCRLMEVIHLISHSTYSAYNLQTIFCQSLDKKLKAEPKY